jgi:hypothetical protein
MVADIVGNHRGDHHEQPKHGSGTENDFFQSQRTLPQPNRVCPPLKRLALE